jgi:hypothetical protein
VTSVERGSVVNGTVAVGSIRTGVASTSTPGADVIWAFATVGIAVASSSRIMSLAFTTF